MSVDRLTAADIPAYDEFLLGRSESLIYHSTRFKRFLTALDGWEEETLLLRDGGRIRAALPCMSRSHPEGRVINSIPFFGSNGGILSDDPEATAALCAAWNERAQADDVVSATLIENPFATAAAPVVSTHTDARISQATDLPVGADDPWSRLAAQISSSARRNVNKARREGFEVRRDEEAFDLLRRLHQADMAAKGGQAKTDDVFRLLPAHLRSGEDLRLYVASKNGADVALLLVLLHHHTAEYYIPAIDPEHRQGQPLSLLVSEAMADATRAGCRRWNWGGTWTTQTGVYRFKRKWAAQERPYRYHTQLNRLDLLSWSPEQILAGFPRCYVLPFAALDAGTA